MAIVGEESNLLGPLSYPQTDVFVFCCNNYSNNYNNNYIRYNYNSSKAERNCILFLSLLVLTMIHANEILILVCFLVTLIYNYSGIQRYLTTVLILQ